MYIVQIFDDEEGKELDYSIYKNIMMALIDVLDPMAEIYKRWTGISFDNDNQIPFNPEKPKKVYVSCQGYEGTYALHFKMSKRYSVSISDVVCLDNAIGNDLKSMKEKEM